MVRGKDTFDCGCCTLQIGHVGMIQETFCETSRCHRSYIRDIEVIVGCND